MKYTIKSFIFFVLISIISTPIIAHTALHKAVIVIPVADLIGQPISSLFTNRSTQSSYEQIPFYSEDITDNQACARLHQLLFNEIVEIVTTRGDEVLVKIPHIFYTTHQSNKPHTQYWMHKNSLMTLHNLSRKNIDISKFPKPITYQPKNILSNNTITLHAPFHDPITEKTYSAGTRFVRKNKKNAKTNFAVHIFDPTDQTFKITYVPKRLCLTTSQNKKHCMNTFVNILKQWANQKHGNAIPYVWGGCSFIARHKPNTAIEQKKKIDEKKTITFFGIPNDNHKIKTGLDCTGMVARAAHIAGIPYFFKNSTTVVHYLKPIQKYQFIEPGDIIWIPGHIMVVSDIYKNTIIESRAYDHGYGHVQEIPLHEEFKNINTFNDLQASIKQKRPIERLHKDGSVLKTITSMKILKLSSVWD